MGGIALQRNDIGLSVFYFTLATLFCARLFAFNSYIHATSLCCLIPVLAPFISSWWMLHWLICIQKHMHSICWVSAASSSAFFHFPVFSTVICSWKKQICDFQNMWIFPIVLESFIALSAALWGKLSLDENCWGSNFS